MPREKPLAHPAGTLDDGQLLRLLGYNLSRADLRLRKLFNRYMDSVQLRPVEFSVLVLLESNAQVNQRQLGEALDVSAPNLAVLLDRLTARGLLTRVRSDLDRRAQYLHLTAQGKTLLALAKERANAMESQVTGMLSPGERTLLTKLLRKLASLPTDV